MKILLLGGSGQLGYELQKRGQDLNFEIISPVHTEVDVSEGDAISYLAEKIRADVIINSAAYTLVDKAEDEKDKAYLINTQGAANAARAARNTGVRLIHISTDYVFDGTASEPITEQAPTNPLSVYGASKLAGENLIQEILGKQGLIVRTSWLHGCKGKNFLQTMIRLFQSEEIVKVVDDNYGSPTWAGWLAEVVLDLTRIDCGGVLHASCEGKASWFDFAREIYTEIQPILKDKVKAKLLPQGAAEALRPAQRPKYSVLECSALTRVLGRKPIRWQEGVRGHLKDLGYQV